jgi:outer membrane beta-barrel protein
MTARRTSRALALLALVAALLPGGATAQTKADAFAGKIPPVSGQLYRKAGRLELATTGNLSLNDAFFTKYFGGAKLGYHFTEFLSAAVHASGGTTRQSGSTVVCTAAGGCQDASEAQLRQVPGRIKGIVGAEIAWSPIYGKLNVLAERVAHFDLSILAGPDVIFHEEISSRKQEEDLALLGASASPATTTAYGGHVGLAARVFLTEWMAARLEVKDYIYAVKVPNAGSGSDVQNQFFTEIGVSFFFPTRNRPTR